MNAGLHHEFVPVNTLVRQLQSHYEKLAAQQDRGLGGQLKALTALITLDGLADDGALDGHRARYLQMLRDGVSCSRTRCAGTT